MPQHNNSDRPRNSFSPVSSARGSGLYMASNRHHCKPFSSTAARISSSDSRDPSFDYWTLAKVKCSWNIRFVINEFIIYVSKMSFRVSGLLLKWCREKFSILKTAVWQTIHFVYFESCTYRVKARFLFDRTNLDGGGILLDAEIFSCCLACSLASDDCVQRQAFTSFWIWQRSYPVIMCSVTF